MATSRDFNGANHTLAPPPGTEEFVPPLRCFVGKDQIVSCWRLTEEEKAVIARDGVVWLSVMGHQHPPVTVSALPLVQQLDVDGKPIPYDIG